MPAALPAAPPLDTAAPGRDLSSLRGELDRIDDAMHDLVMRRADVVQQIAALGVKGRVPLRPGREAAILRRLLARHAGPFPVVGIVRLWRELICGMTALQQPLRIAVPDDPCLLAAVREHFGALVPLAPRAGPAGAMEEVRAGRAAAAVLPLPRDDDADAWWAALLDRQEPRLHVVARLPFWAERPEGAPRPQAFVVTSVKPDPSGLDRSLLGLERQDGRPRLLDALAAAGFEAGRVVLGRDGRALADVDGFVTEDDPRLPALASGPRPALVLGAYAVPVEARP